MTETIIYRDPLPKVRRIALAFVLASALIAGSFAVVAHEDEKPASAAPVAVQCATGLLFRTIPPTGGARGGPFLANTQGLNFLQGAAENRVWTVIRGQDDGVWITHFNIDLDTVTNSPGDWTNSWMNLGGQTISSPRLYAPASSAGGSDAMVIRTIGTDGHVYGRTLGHQGWTPWYAVSVSQTSYYGTPAPTSTTIVDAYGPDWPIYIRRTPNNGTQSGVPEYRCDHAP